jgi:hypothetical protein
MYPYLAEQLKKIKRIMIFLFWNRVFILCLSFNSVEGNILQTSMIYNPLWKSQEVENMNKKK